MINTSELSVEPDQLQRSVAFSEARQRLGSEPLEAPFARVCGPLVTASTKGANYRQWRLVSMGSRRARSSASESRFAGGRGSA